ncbi:MAG: cation:proton antiporter [Flavobacteriia bacterium]|nr:cation:proton antiporter [Flavobacteriia bacterium]
MNYFFEHFLKAFQLPLKNPVLIFSTILFIILLTPIVLRKMKIPAIIGLIISGVIIGPNGFGIIGEKLLESDGSVKLFSTIGLLYIMFMAGLELDMKEFKKYRTKSFTFGFLTFIIPISLGFPICHYGLGLNLTASILTASMFATHTLVAYPIVSKLGISKNVVVAVAVGGTILTDTAVLIILAIISSSVEGQLDFSFWLRLITSLAIFTFIMFAIIPRIARWFFSKLESEKTAHYIFVLSIIFFAAFLAEMAGVEHIIGAFVAGLVLNKLIPHTSALMNRIDFIGNSLFIPFFLISVGMIVDYKVLFQGPWALIVAGVLTTFALISKWLATFVTQLIFKMTNTERQVIFGLSSAHAAATLAIIIVGFEKGILNSQVVNGTILLILVTCMVASFVTENAGKRLLIQLAESGEESELIQVSRNQHLLIAINELKGNERLIDLSVLITDKRVLNPISVVSVLPNNQEAEQRIRTSRKEMDEIVKHFSDGEFTVNVVTTIDHNQSSGIARVSKELFTDILVLNDSRKINLLKRFVGDDRNHLLDVCDKTIFFCQLEKPTVSYQKIKLICPPLAHLETSFISWSERILRLAKELNITIEFIGTLETFEAIKKVKKAVKLSVTTKHIELNELEEYFLLNQIVTEDELIVFCSARSGSVSYLSFVDSFPNKIEKAYPDNDFILIYPSQEISSNAFTAYEDFDNSPLSKGVETIQKIGKEVGSIFKKNEQS